MVLILAEDREFDGGEVVPAAWKQRLVLRASVTPLVVEEVEDETAPSRWAGAALVSPAAPDEPGSLATRDLCLRAAPAV